MVVSTNPWSSGEHDHVDYHQCDDTPSKYSSRCVVCIAVLECADREEEEPSDTASRTSGVDTTDMLNEASQENAPPERSPLKNSQSDRVIQLERY